MSSNENTGDTWEDVAARIVEALRGLRFGTIEVQVHESRVVRITRTEKILLEPPARSGAKK